MYKHTHIYLIPIYTPNYIDNLYTPSMYKITEHLHVQSTVYTYHITIYLIYILYLSTYTLV